MRPPHTHLDALTLRSRQQRSPDPPSPVWHVNRCTVQHAHPIKKRKALQARVPLPGWGPLRCPHPEDLGVAGHGTGEPSSRHHPPLSLERVRASAGTLTPAPARVRAPAQDPPPQEAAWAAADRKPRVPISVPPGGPLHRTRRCGGAGACCLERGWTRAWGRVQHSLGGSCVLLCAPRPPPVPTNSFL